MTNEQYRQQGDKDFCNDIYKPPEIGIKRYYYNIGYYSAAYSLNHFQNYKGFTHDP